jgi:hypothetical protein
MRIPWKGNYASISEELLRKLSGNDCRIYQLIGLRTFYGEKEYYTSNREIARDMNIYKETCRISLDNLEKDHLIAITTSQRGIAIRWFCPDSDQLEWVENPPKWVENPPSPPPDHVAEISGVGGKSTQHVVENPPTVGGKSTHSSYIKQNKKEDQRIQKQDRENVPLAADAPPPGALLVIPDPLPQNVAPKKRVPKIKNWKFEQEDLSLALEWISWSKETHPHLGTKPDEAADTLRKVRTLIERDHSQMKNIFEWIKQDDFWSRQCLSPVGLLKKGNNGNEKITNLLASMTAAKEKKKFVNKAFDEKFKDIRL